MIETPISLDDLKSRADFLCGIFGARGWVIFDSGLLSYERARIRVDIAFRRMTQSLLRFSDMICTYMIPAIDRAAASLSELVKEMPNG